MSMAIFSKVERITVTKNCNRKSMPYYKLPAMTNCLKINSGTFPVSFYFALVWYGTVSFSQYHNLEMLDITGNHITKLNGEDLRALVVRLCEAEFRCLNLPLSAVTAGGHQNEADGGLDVRVELPNDSPDLDFIPKGITGFQVKQQDMPAKAIDAEMRPEGKLRSSIRELGSKHGSYVIISGLGSTADFALKNRKIAMQTAISDLPQNASPTLDFYDRDRLASWVREYPGVTIWLRERIGEPLAGWLPYGNMGIRRFR